MKTRVRKITIFHYIFLHITVLPLTLYPPLCLYDFFFLVWTFFYTMRDIYNTLKKNNTNVNLALQNLWTNCCATNITDNNGKCCQHACFMIYFSKILVIIILLLCYYNQYYFYVNFISNTHRYTVYISRNRVICVDCGNIYTNWILSLSCLKGNG